MNLTALEEQYHNCNRCPQLCTSRSQVVFGSGNYQAEILLIGEAPGANEDKQGVPFCGMSGQILDQLLNSINLNRKDIFITNTILCHPENNRNPSPEEVENCRERLDQLIELMQPKVILTLGNFATQRILGKTGIKSLRGKSFPHKINNHTLTVVPVIHPANYLYSGRNPELLQQMKYDFKKVLEIIQVKQEQKNLFEF